MKFHQKGDVIVITPDPTELKPKDVLDQIRNFENAIESNKEKLRNMKDQIPRFEEAIQINKDRLKDLKKFEEWAKTAQIPKLKSLVNELKDGVLKGLNKKNDPNLTEEQNKAQLNYLYKSTVARQPEIIENISQEIVQKFLIDGDILENPF